MQGPLAGAVPGWYGKRGVFRYIRGLNGCAGRRPRFNPMEPSPQTTTESSSRLLSIGAVARSSGLSEATIRVWERRYGIPTPVRLPSGHRRYRPEQVRHLRLVAEALAQGSRPGEIIRLDSDELVQHVSNGRNPDPEPQLQEWIRGLDDQSVRAHLKAKQAELGLVEFLDSFVAPLLAWLGTSWARGDLEVRHEHFLTEILQDHLRFERMHAANTTAENSKGLVVLACLPNELHGLGLHMVALVCERNHVRHRILGTDTPLEDIARTSFDLKADAVAVSIPSNDQGASLYRRVDELREQLDDSVALLMGGMGVRRIRRSPSGVERFGSMTEFDSWLRNRFQDSPAT